jgi:XTP/dITP diphosphohydrolase
VILLLGSHNEGKIRELRELLTNLGAVKLLTFHDRPFTAVEETGRTFRENALLKARAICAETGVAVLAEDAGLEVNALGGEPGVRSARFAGIPTDYTRNNALLLERLTGICDRRARFVSVAALRLPDGREFTGTGILVGRIAEKAAGAGGFGYDPLFIPDGFTQTLAELSLAEKNQISHRCREVLGIKQVLKALVQDQE